LNFLLACSGLVEDPATSEVLTGDFIRTYPIRCSASRMKRALLEKPLHWVGSSKNDLLEFPPEVVDDFGYVLYLVLTSSSAPATPRTRQDKCRSCSRCDGGGDKGGDSERGPPDTPGWAAAQCRGDLVWSPWCRLPCWGCDRDVDAQGAGGKYPTRHDGNRELGPGCAGETGSASGWSSS